jgi:hypothetical protein
MEAMLAVRCKCGGKLKKSKTEVEFLGIDFGIQPCEVCTQCGSEYLSQELIEKIEKEVKRRGFFGLERRARVTKSGNSLVIRVPKEIAKSLKIDKDTAITIYPTEKRKLIVEIEE